MNYRLNTDRLVFYSILLWVVFPPGLFAWAATPIRQDDIEWLSKFSTSFMDHLWQGGVLFVVIGFLAAALMWGLHKLSWGRGMKILALFFITALALFIVSRGSVAGTLCYIPLALINPIVYFSATSGKK